MTETWPRACKRQHMTQPWEGGIHHPRQAARGEKQGRASVGVREGGGTALSPSAPSTTSQAWDPLTDTGDSEHGEGET